MPSEIRWGAPASAVSVLSTELNALANGANAVTAAAIDADAARSMLADVYLTVTFAAAPSTGGYCDLYFLTSPDGGTTWSDGSASVDPQGSGQAAQFNLRPVTTAQVVKVERVPMPAADYKPLLRNRSGQAFPATGSTVRIVKYSPESQ